MTLNALAPGDITLLLIAGMFVPSRLFCVVLVLGLLFGAVHLSGCTIKPEYTPTECERICANNEGVTHAQSYACDCFRAPGMRP